MNSFIINKGILEYADHRMDDPFSYHLSELTMSVDSISSQEDWIDLYARMLLNNRGKLNAELGINPQDPMNMTLDVAISDFILSDLKDPKVSVGKIVWDTFKNLIVRTVAAPYDLLADMIGVDPKDIQAIEFAYADTLLTEERTEQLDLLLRLEEKKEGLGIELIYYNDAGKENEQVYLAEARIRQGQLSETDSLDLARTCAELTEQFTLTRIKLVDSYLKSIKDSTAIFISRSHADAPGNMGSIPGFEVKYSMEEYKTDD